MKEEKVVKKPESYQNTASEFDKYNFQDDIYCPKPIKESLVDKRIRILR